MERKSDKAGTLGAEARWKAVTAAAKAACGESGGVPRCLVQASERKAPPVAPPFTLAHASVTSTPPARTRAARRPSDDVTALRQTRSQLRQLRVCRTLRCSPTARRIRLSVRTCYTEARCRVLALSAAARACFWGGNEGTHARTHTDTAAPASAPAAPDGVLGPGYPPSTPGSVAGRKGHAESAERITPNI